MGEIDRQKPGVPPRPVAGRRLLAAGMFVFACVVIGSLPVSVLSTVWAVCFVIIIVVLVARFVSRRVEHWEQDC